MSRQAARELPQALEFVRECDACGSREKLALHPELHMVKCGGCGLVYVDRRVREEDLPRVYGEHYFSSQNSQDIGYDDYVGQREHIQRTFRRRLAQIEARLGAGRGRLLDVGCAAGFFLDVARDAGWEVQGVELSEYMARVARETLQLSVHHGTLATFPPPARPYDVVTMWDVIEHALSPISEFSRAARLVRPGGLFVMSTPDVDSWPARFYGKGWMGIKPHEHFFFFSRKTIQRSLEEHGFRVEEIHTVGKYVTLDFFIQRVGHYYPRLARSLSRGARFLGIGDRAFYVDPHDLMVIFARRV